MVPHVGMNWNKNLVNSKIDLKREAIHEIPGWLYSKISGQSLKLNEFGRILFELIFFNDLIYSLYRCKTNNNLQRGKHWDV